MVSKDNTRISLCVDKKDFQAFQSAYRYCLSRFIRNAISMAVMSRPFFQQVFFNEVEVSTQSDFSEV